MVFALLTEHISQQQTRAQIQTAHALRRTDAYKLDRASFQAITDAGRPHFKKAVGCAGQLAETSVIQCPRQPKSGG